MATREEDAVAAREQLAVSIQVRHDQIRRIHRKLQLRALLGHGHKKKEKKKKKEKRKKNKRGQGFVNKIITLTSKSNLAWAEGDALEGKELTLDHRSAGRQALET